MYAYGYKVEWTLFKDTCLPTSLNYVSKRKTFVILLPFDKKHK